MAVTVSVGPFAFVLSLPSRNLLDSGQNKNAGPDNATNTEKRKLPCLQLSSKRSLLIARLAEFIDRLCSEDIQHFLPKCSIWFSMRRRTYR
jgi:hypothetical protein